MTNQVCRLLTTVSCGLLISIGLSCEKYSVETGDMVDSGSWYESGFRWPHDGNPFESEHFVIFSDASSLASRQLLSQICEDAYRVIMGKLGLADNSAFRFPAGRNGKIHIYSYKEYFPRTWGGQAFYGGFLIYSPDHPERTLGGSTALEKYVPTVKHELMHAIQTLFLGANDERVLYSWFAEGIAIDISDDVFYDYVDTRQHLDSLIALYGAVNPVSIRHSWMQPATPEGIRTFYLYPMYWLCVRYLLDTKGQGGTFTDVRDVLIDAGQGIPFDTSLKNRFGISQQEYQAQFFELMDSYLQ